MKKFAQNYFVISRAAAAAGAAAATATWRCTEALELIVMVNDVFFSLTLSKTFRRSKSSKGGTGGQTSTSSVYIQCVYVRIVQSLKEELSTAFSDYCQSWRGFFFVDQPACCYFEIYLSNKTLTTSLGRATYKCISFSVFIWYYYTN